MVALFFIRVWVWHVSPESADRYSRQQYGGFFRYLTFCCFTVQVLQLILATLTDFTPKVKNPVKSHSMLSQGKGIKLKRDADDLSCVVFVLANCVTLLFHAIEFLTPGGILLENHLIVHWIDITTHKLNSVVAWLDIIFCHPRRCVLFKLIKMSFQVFLSFVKIVVYLFHWLCFLDVFSENQNGHLSLSISKRTASSIWLFHDATYLRLHHFGFLSFGKNVKPMDAKRHELRRHRKLGQSSETCKTNTIRQK